LPAVLAPVRRQVTIAFIVGAVLVLALGAWWLSIAPSGKPKSAASPPPALTANYVADAQCAQCHAKAAEAWRGTHHQRAMEVANAQTVVGDFANAKFTHKGATTTFSQRDGKYFITMEGPDGKPAEYEVKYTFGVAPLQQYLVTFPGGRLQAPTVAWDTERKHWFALYPNDRHMPDDPLHSTGRYQNWNLMCSECHSTDLRRNYDARTDTYDTKWAEQSVGCQACHGPGSAHVEWAKAASGKDAKGQDARTLGLLVDFRGNDSRYQVEACAPCHSRRQRLTDGELPGKPFLDNYHPALLREGLYYPDGQQREEVYVWGSFLQSKMYAQGVRCTDCHDPHSLQLKAEGNALCMQCHTTAGNPRFPTLAKKDYDTPAHHHHVAGSPGAACANCHIPAKNYMVIDARPDHSFRIPRPDLSVQLGTPNACNNCHDKNTPQWAADAVAKWFGPNRRQEPGFAAVFAAARAGAPAALSGLDQIASDRTSPALVRASALDLARAYGAGGGRLGVQAKNDPDALVRAAAASALRGLPPGERFAYAAALLRDPVKLVRIEAARAVADVPVASMPEGERAAFDLAWAELLASERSLSDMPSTQLNLAGLAWQQGDFGAAETEYRRALAHDPYLAPAYNGLASLLSGRQRNPEAESVLRGGLARLPDNGDLRYALALLLAEEKRDPEAIVEMEKAAKLSPSQSRILYNLGLMQQRSGKLDAAAASLRKSGSMGDADATYALAMLHLQQKRPDLALPLIEELTAANPGNQQLAKMRDQLRQAGAGKQPAGK
jgi:predicted CXXCH cytochrome family protein